MENKIMNLKSMSVLNLFGSFDHQIVLSPQSNVTVIAGPNGTGKTHILMIACAILNLDLRKLFELPFGEARLEFDDKSSVVVSKNTTGGEEEIDFLLFKRVEREKVEQQVQVSSEGFGYDADSEVLPSWLRRVDQDRWVDERSGRYLSTRQIERRYGVSFPWVKSRELLIEDNPWLKDIMSLGMATFIDTKRLEIPVPNSYKGDVGLKNIRQGQRDPASRMGAYIQRIEGQIAEARRASLRQSQVADEKFAFKLLEGSQREIDQESLARTYEELSNLNNELSKNGLSGRAMTVEIPDNANSTQRLVLDVFLKDWRTKLAPFLPVHRKLTALKRIVNNKFIGKKIDINRDGDIRFKSSSGEYLGVEQLSSGEQHLLALFTLLLFDSERGSLVLIDEPEISLHAAWKHAFIEDLEEVSEISNLTVMMATHSTAIVNGRWDLVRELEVPEGV